MPFPDPSPLPQAATAIPPGWLKVDFHLHSSEDPEDQIDHSAVELVQRAHALGFHAISITLHGQVMSDPAAFDAARELGLLLIPGAEMRLDGADVLVLNINQEEAAELRRLRDLEALRQRRGDAVLIIAPHPFYVLGGSIGKRRLLEYMPVFDAVEISHFRTFCFDPNRPAICIAKQLGKPLIATSDAHRMDAFGNHYSLVQAPSDTMPESITAEAIFAAIRNHCVQNISPALSLGKFAHHIWWIFVQHEVQKLWARLALKGNSK